MLVRERRPSHKELQGKIALAKEAASEEAIDLADPVSIALDAQDLDYMVEQISTVLGEILAEIEPNHYTGKRPPQQSYKAQIRNCDLFAFRWESKRFGCESYLKFALKDNRLWVVSLHPHREGHDE